MQSELKILFLDDHPGLRDGTALLLQQKSPSEEAAGADAKKAAARPIAPIAMGGRGFCNPARRGSACDKEKEGRQGVRCMDVAF